MDYIGFSDASRASIQMTHSAFGPTVSLEEAQRIERETAEHLIKSRKLSLIVDLDQTIVHATVDPTVGEWITEGEAWETKRAAKAASTTPRPSDETDNDLSHTADDECNPNWEALKDVKRFRLGPESFGPPSMRGAQRKGKNKLVENEGCMYYVKPRSTPLSPSPFFLVAYTRTDLAGKNFFVTQPPSMKCMFIQWELVPTRKKYVLQLIRMEAFSEDVC